MKYLAVSLLPFGGKREKKTFKTLKDLSSSVVASVVKFEEGVTAYSEQDFEEGGDLLIEVDELESEADKHGFKFESMLGGGAFLPAFRGDLSRLAESIDDIADMAEESLREIYRRPKVFEVLAEAEKEDEEVKSIRTGLVELAGKSVASVQSLDEAVSILMDDMDAAAEKAEEVHRKERDSDIKEDDIAKELYRHEDLLDPVTVLQVRRLIDDFGSISDSAESSGDILSAMTESLKA